MFKELEFAKLASQVSFWYCIPGWEFRAGLFGIREEEDINVMNCVCSGAPIREIYAVLGEEPVEVISPDGKVLYERVLPQGFPALTWVDHKLGDQVVGDQELGAHEPDQEVGDQGLGVHEGIYGPDQEVGDQGLGVHEGVHGPDQEVGDDVSGTTQVPSDPFAPQSDKDQQQSCPDGSSQAETVQQHEDQEEDEPEWLKEGFETMEDEDTFGVNLREEEEPINQTGDAHHRSGSDYVADQGT